MSITEVLVDGTFWVAIAVAAVVLLVILVMVPAIVLRRRVTVLRLSPAVVAAVLAVWWSPPLFDLSAGLIYYLRHEGASVCLMPTNHPIRDFSPGLLAVASGSIGTDERLVA